MLPATAACLENHSGQPERDIKCAQYAAPGGEHSRIVTVTNC